MRDARCGSSRGRWRSAAAQRNGSFSSRRCPLTHDFEAAARAAAAPRPPRRLVDHAGLAAQSRRAARRAPMLLQHDEPGRRARATPARSRRCGCRGRDRCRSAPRPAGAPGKRARIARDRLVAAARVQRDHEIGGRAAPALLDLDAVAELAQQRAPSATRCCGCRCARAAAAGVTSAIFNGEAFRLNCDADYSKAAD